MLLEKKKAKKFAVKSTDYTVADNAVDLTKRTVKGLYGSYDFFDSDGDVLRMGCAAKSIKEHGVEASKSTYKIKHLLHHDWEQVVAAPSILKEDEIEVEGKTVKGIYFETKMPNTTVGNDTLINYQEGTYDQHSIGFQYIQGKYWKKGDAGWTKFLDSIMNPKAAEKAGEAYEWTEIKLFEGSTVAFGANELTPYLGVKSENKEGMLLKFLSKLEYLQKSLSSGKLSQSKAEECALQIVQLKQITEELFSSKKDQKDTLTQSRQSKNRYTGFSFSNQ